MTLKTLALGSALVASALAGAPSCPVTSSTPLSCHNTTAVQDTCCFNAPGGQLLQTQFWDTDPVTGPDNSWTIHGLWPDNCDGTYQQFCDNSRNYTNITEVIQSYDPELYTYMTKYWKDQGGDDESFWEHEWSKHGTCISTLEPSCYTDYKPAEELYDFVNRTVSLFKSLDSYSFLSAAGITPSATQTYASADIIAALSKGHGAEPVIQCADGALDEIWYFFNTQGSVQTGQFKPAAPDGSKGDCPATGIKYLPKGGSGTQPTTTTTTKTTKSTPPPMSTPRVTKTRFVKRAGATSSPASSPHSSTPKTTVTKFVKRAAAATPASSPNSSPQSSPKTTVTKFVKRAAATPSPASSPHSSPHTSAHTKFVKRAVATPSPASSPASSPHTSKPKTTYTKFVKRAVNTSPVSSPTPSPSPSPTPSPGRKALPKN